jgi:hypothetical protein
MAAATYHLAHRGTAERSRNVSFAEGSAAAIDRTSRSPVVQAPLDAVLNRSARVAGQHAIARALGGGPGAVAQARFARLLSRRGDIAGPIPRGAARAMPASPVQASPVGSPRTAAEPPVQLLKDGKGFLAGVRDGELKQLTDIARMLDFYHEIPATLETSQARLQALRKLDHLIAVAHKTLPEQDGPPLLALYRESEQEHREIVAELAKIGPEAWLEDPNLLPVDLSGLEKQEILQVGKLWQSLLSGTGNLRIRQGEDPAFGARLQAGIAKLLQGPFGRELITSLSGDDRGEDLRVTLGSDFAAELLGTKVSQGAGSEAIPLSKLQDGNKSFELQEPGKNEVGTVRVGKGLYKPGQRTGSFVRIVGAGAHTLPGESLRPALTPDFITIGHELGHASRFQTGGSIPLNDAAWSNLNVADPVERELWGIPEEYVNITGVENALRAEHSLEPRRYHQSNIGMIRGAKARVANLAQFKDAFGEASEGLNSKELELLQTWPEFLRMYDEQYKAELDWSQGATLHRMLANIASFRKVAGVLHQLQLSGRTPEKLYESAEKAKIWRRLNLDTEFMKGWRKFNKLYQGEDANTFVAQAPDLADMLAGVINRVIVEAAVERSESSSLSLSGHWFGGL